MYAVRYGKILNADVTRTEKYHFQKLTSFIVEVNITTEYTCEILTIAVLKNNHRITKITK